MNRRAVLRLVVLGGALTAGAGALLSACGGGVNCTDTHGLTAEEITARTAAAYVEQTTTPGRQCSSCNFFVGTSPTACGTCRVLKGPFNPAGSCRLWAAKAT